MTAPKPSEYLALSQANAGRYHMRGKHGAWKELTFAHRPVNSNPPPPPPATSTSTSTLSSTQSLSVNSPSPTPVEMDAGLDNYWRLQDRSRERRIRRLKAALDGSGYILPPKPSRARLERLLVRVERNLLCYDMCTEEQLQSFVRARRAMKTPLNATRARLIRTLENADRNCTFRFLDLPADLRVHVMSIYVAAFPDYLVTPLQPPLARTSKLMRQEVLPIFYREASFCIRINRSRCPLSFNPETHAFLDSMGDQNLALVRKLGFAMGLKGPANNDDWELKDGGMQHLYSGGTIVLAVSDGRFSVTATGTSNDEMIMRAVEKVLS